jgi:hypothetical protein
VVEALYANHKVPEVAFRAVRALARLALLPNTVITALCEMRAWVPLELAMRGHRDHVALQVTTVQHMACRAGCPLKPVYANSTTS